MRRRSKINVSKLKAKRSKRQRAYYATNKQIWRKWYQKNRDRILAEGREKRLAAKSVPDIPKAQESAV